MTKKQFFFLNIILFFTVTHVSYSMNFDQICEALEDIQDIKPAPELEDNLYTCSYKNQTHYLFILQDSSLDKRLELINSFSFLQYRSKQTILIKASCGNESLCGFVLGLRELFFYK